MLQIILFLASVPFMLGACSSEDIYAPAAEESEAKIIYVAVDGNDENTGKIDLPLKTIDYALSIAKAGDTVMLREGSYNQKVTFPNSGLLNQWITLKSYPKERAKIDGTGLSATGWTALVTLKNIRCISIQDIDICNYENTAPNADPEGIFIDGESRNIQIKNCKIYNIKSNSPGFNNGDWRSAHAILVIGDGAIPISNLVIEDCEIFDIHTGTSETLSIVGNVDGFTIRNNIVRDVENIGIIIAGGDNLRPSMNPEINFARNGVVSDNLVYNCSHTNSPEVWGPDRYGAIGIYVCGGANTIIERNVVYGCDRGIGMVSESDIATKHCIVRNNFVYNNNRTGIYMGDYLNFTNGGTNNCQIINNTLFFNNSVLGAFGEIEGEIRMTKNCVDNVVKNNVVYARPNDVFVHKYTTTGRNNLIDHNLYFTTGIAKWIWNDVEYTDYESWKNACNGDQNSTVGQDPQLLDIDVNKPNLHIKATSPAKNTGVVISENVNGATDIDGKQRIVDNKISKGAQQ